MTATWPQADPSWDPCAAEWFEVVGEVHPRPTPAAAAAAGQFAAAFSGRIAADVRIPTLMVFDAEDALGVREEMRCHPDTVLAKLVYHGAAPADYFHRRHAPQREFR